MSVAASPGMSFLFSDAQPRRPGDPALGPESAKSRFAGQGERRGPDLGNGADRRADSGPMSNAKGPERWETRYPLLRERRLREQRPVLHHGKQNRVQEKRGFGGQRPFSAAGRSPFRRRIRRRCAQSGAEDDGPAILNSVLKHGGPAQAGPESGLSACTGGRREALAPFLPAVCGRSDFAFPRQDGRGGGLRRAGVSPGRLFRDIGECSREAPRRGEAAVSGRRFAGRRRVPIRPCVFSRPRKGCRRGCSTGWAGSRGHRRPHCLRAGRIPRRRSLRGCP